MLKSDSLNSKIYLIRHITAESTGYQSLQTNRINQMTMPIFIRLAYFINNPYEIFSS